MYIPPSKRSYRHAPYYHPHTFELQPKAGRLTKKFGSENRFLPVSLRQGEGAKWFRGFVQTGNWFSAHINDVQVYNRWVYTAVVFANKLVEGGFITPDVTWSLFLRGLPTAASQQAQYYLVMNQCSLDIAASDTVQTLQTIGRMLFEARLTSRETHEYMRRNGINGIEKIVGLNLVEYPIYYDRKPITRGPANIKEEENFGEPVALMPPPLSPLENSIASSREHSPPTVVPPLVSDSDSSFSSLGSQVSVPSTTSTFLGDHDDPNQECLAHKNQFYGSLMERLRAKMNKDHARIYERHYPSTESIRSISRVSFADQNAKSSDPRVANLIADKSCLAQ
jgi:hypothetical protein